MDNNEHYPQVLLDQNAPALLMKKLEKMQVARPPSAAPPPRPRAV
jgi:hypothetical protein